MNPKTKRKAEELKREVHDSMETFRQEIGNIDHRLWEMKQELDQIQRREPGPCYRDFWLRIAPDLHTRWAERQAYLSRLWADDPRIFDVKITDTLETWGERPDSDTVGNVVSVLVFAVLIGLFVLFGYLFA